MSPFRTSAEYSGFQEQLTPATAGAEASTPDTCAVAKPSVHLPHWWQRVGRRRSAAAQARGVAVT